MRFIRVSLAIVFVMALSMALMPVDAKDKDSRTYSGSYDWKQGGSDELSAEFVPDGEGSWEVTFRFRWSGDRRTWEGTARGNLEDGSSLTGTATSGGRNWIFTAQIEDGVMRGQHSEVKGADTGYDTGTFELRR